jgi:pimeloyl-ACP methyl ester carboxylesterase
MFSTTQPFTRFAAAVALAAGMAGGLAASASVSAFVSGGASAGGEPTTAPAAGKVAPSGGGLAASFDIRHRTEVIDGVEVFYREAGPADAPVVALLHGFPTSSHMFRELIPVLATKYRVIAPDYPGYGESDAPPHTEFEYSFDHFSRIVEELLRRRGADRYSLYLMDYGAPVGFRLFERAPEKVDAFLIQNGNAYEEGLLEFWNPIKAYWNEPTDEHRDALRTLLTIDATKWQYTHGVRDASAISPDTWNHVQPKLDRPGNQEIQLDLFYDYRTNVDRYPAWQALFREHQPPTLITWGGGDFIFPEAGAHPYARDLDDVETHILETGHFALEEDAEFIGARILDFLGRKVAR